MCVVGEEAAAFSTEPPLATLCISTAMRMKSKIYAGMDLHHTIAFTVLR